MGQWETEFANHPIHTEVKTLEQVQSQCAGQLRSEIETEAFNRLTLVTALAFAYLKGLNPQLTPRRFLDRMHTPVTNIRSCLQQFLNNHNAGNLTQANAYADELLTVLPNGALIPSQETFNGIVSELQRNMASMVDGLTSTTTRYSDTVKKLNDSAGSLQKRLDQQNAEINSSKERLDNAIAAFQSQFSESEQSRRDRSTKAENEQHEKLNIFRDHVTAQIKNFIDKKTSEVQAVLGGFEGQAKKAIDDLDARKKQAADLVQLTANITVTGDYSERADQERRAANFWRWVTIALMGILVVGAIVIVELSLRCDSIDWKMLLFRYATAVILVLPAAYAMNESSRHRKMELRYRRMQLELASIDPFLETLPKEKRDELKQTLAGRMFAQPEPAQEKAAIGAKQVFGLLEKTIGAVLGKK